MKNLVLDPRTKLFLVLVMGISITLPVPMYMEVLNMSLFAFLFFFNKQKKGAVKLMIFFISLIALAYIPQDFHPILTSILLPLAYMIRRFMLPIVASRYLIDSTPVALMMSALEKLKVPNNMVITISVMFRFYPTLGQEWKNIKNAMKMRGIGISFVNVLTRPFMTLEYVMIPLLSSSSRIADELSAAGHTKGVDSPYKKVRYKKARFGIADVFIFLYIVACFVAVIVTRFKIIV